MIKRYTKRRSTFTPSPLRRQRLTNTIVVTSCVLLISGGAIGVFNSPVVAGVDTPHGQPVPTQIPVDITFVACADWTNHNPAFTDPDTCVSVSGNRVPVITSDTLLCGNDSYNANGESEELTLTPTLKAKWCK